MRIQGEHMQKVTDALFSLKEATVSLRGFCNQVLLDLHC